MTEQTQPSVSASPVISQNSMALHRQPLTEYVQLSVDDKRQALIEWKLQYEGVELELPSEGEPRLKWLFDQAESSTERALRVKAFETYLDSLRTHSGFELPEVKTLVQERRRVLIDAVNSPTEQSLHDLLDKPGFERFKLQGQHDTQIINRQNLALYGAEQCYPSALLYNLFNDPPEFLQRIEASVLMPSAITNTSITGSKPKAREQLFINWLIECARCEPEGWLTMERVNERNNLLSKKAKVFQPKKKTQADSENVRALLTDLRRYPEYTEAIQTRPRRGNAWRLKNWKDQ